MLTWIGFEEEFQSLKIKFENKMCYCDHIACGSLRLHEMKNILYVLNKKVKLKHLSFKINWPWKLIVNINILLSFDSRRYKGYKFNVFLNTIINKCIEYYKIKIFWINSFLENEKISFLSFKFVIKILIRFLYSNFFLCVPLF